MNKDDFADTLRGWVEDGDLKAQNKLATTGMRPEHKKRGMEQLLKLTPSKMIGGKLHFLLHRTFADGTPEARRIFGGTYDSTEHKIYIGGKQFPAHNSWSPHITTPSEFHGGEHVVSAWIPETHISFMPFVYSRMMAGSSSHPFFSKEKEVIVRPGKYKMYKYAKLGNSEGDSMYGGIDTAYHDRSELHKRNRKYAAKLDAQIKSEMPVPPGWKLKGQATS
jgi:hypothetical protein